MNFFLNSHILNNYKYKYKHLEQSLNYNVLSEHVMTKFYLLVVKISTYLHGVTNF